MNNSSKSESPLLRVKGLHKSFPIHKGIFRREIGRIHAVRDVSFDVMPGETVGVVGESGCGKSTLVKTIMRLYDPSKGHVELLGENFSLMKGKKLRTLRKDMQMIFQDPLDSLNARMTIFDILSEPYKIHGIKMSYKETQEKIIQLLQKVGLPKTILERYPHEFSGGQCQRIGIARALTLKPKLLVCDEPVSALDVSVQSQVINLLLKLQQDLDISYIFISHDLTVVRHISDKVLVMYLGEMVEFTDSVSLYTRPMHPYTKVLLTSIPNLSKSKDHKKIILKGEVPSASNPPSGCKFHTRCPYAEDRCKKESPQWRAVNDNGRSHFVACHFAEKLASL